MKTFQQSKVKRTILFTIIVHLVSSFCFTSVEYRSRHSEKYDGRKSGFPGLGVSAPDALLSSSNQEEKSDEEKTLRQLRFSGVGRLYSNDASTSQSNETQSDLHFQVVERLNNSTVAVIGLGGVGSWAAEALCRSGVGNLILVDLDDICISNTNRQLHATSTTVGKMKIDEMRRRLLDINPHCQITNIHEFVTENNVNNLLDRMLPSLDVLIDAIDSRQAKTALIASCVEKRIPIVTVGGAAGKIDTTKIEVEDLTRVNGDKLLTSTRHQLRKLYGFSGGKSWKERKGRQPKKWRIPAVHSTESTRDLPQSKDSLMTFRRCDGALGTACFVTGTFGFAAAGEVVKMLASDKPLAPPKAKFGKNK